MTVKVGSCLFTTDLHRNYTGSGFSSVGAVSGFSGGGASLVIEEEIQFQVTAGYRQASKQPDSPPRFRTFNQRTELLAEMV